MTENKFLISYNNSSRNNLVEFTLLGNKIIISPSGITNNETFLTYLI